MTQDSPLLRRSSLALVLLAAAAGCEKNPLEGLVSQDVTSRFDRFNVATGEREKLATPKTVRAGSQATATIDGKLVVIGGEDATFVLLDDVDIYDPETNAWTSGAPWPNPRRHAETVVVGDHICVAGGFTTGFDEIAGFECYDYASDTWDVDAPLPGNRYVYVPVVYDGKVYAFGNTGSDTTTGASVFDFAVGDWTALTSMPNNCSPEVAALGPDNKIHLFDCSLVYDPATNSYTSGPRVESTVAHPRAITVGDKIYVAFEKDLDHARVFSPLSAGEGTTASLPVLPDHRVPRLTADADSFSVYFVDEADNHRLFRYTPADDGWTEVSELTGDAVEHYHGDGLGQIGGFLYMIGFESDGSLSI